MSEVQAKYKPKVKPSIIKAIRIHERCQKRKKKFYDKSMREPDSEVSDRFFELYHLYVAFEKRSSDLLHRLRFPQKFGESLLLHDYYGRRDLEIRLEQKWERRLKFENQPRIYIWFAQTSLNSDYGQFRCEKCNATFFHSPSSVSIGINKTYNCICGNCVNTIQKMYGLKEIF